MTLCVSDTSFSELSYLEDITNLQVFAFTLFFFPS